MMSSPKTGRIIGSRKDGLGARLLLLLNCLKMGQQFDAPAFIYWPKEDSLATNMEHPEKLFSDVTIQTRFLSQKDYIAANKSAVPLWRFLSDRDPRRLEQHLADGGDVLVLSLIHI